jgi:hypothetical protein
MRSPRHHVAYPELQLVHAVDVEHRAQLAMEELQIAQVWPAVR